MKSRHLFTIITSALALLGSIQPAQAAPVSFENACSASEKWSAPEFLSPSDAAAFQSFLKKQAPPIFGFSQGMAHRQFASTDEQTAFGEYWVARSFFESKMLHTAHSGFTSIISKPVKQKTAIYQLAALGCLVEIQARYPTLEVLNTAELSTQISALVPFAISPHEKAVLHAAAGVGVRNLIANPNAKSGHFNVFLTALRGGGAHEKLAKGLIAARFGNHTTAIAEMDAFLADSSIPDSLKRFVDHAHLIASRANYATKNFKASVEHLKAVRKSSNELADTLSELTWAQLLNFRYDESIGTAMNLQSGGLRRTFAPEAPMVMAMAMNELCQYQDSIRAIRLFQKNYEPIHRWLANWNEHPQPLYEQAIAHIAKKAKAPDRIASEWIRSAVFISHQDEMNLMLDENDRASTITKSGSELQHKMATDILKTLRDLKPRYKVAKMKQKPGELLAKTVLVELDRLKRQIVDLRRLQRSAPIWHKVIGSQVARNPARKAALIASINKNLAARTQRMFLQLEEIAENLQMVEIEIFNGASHDIIWQSAHPEYKKVAAQIPGEETVSDVKTWDWGRIPKAVEEEGEIWEDELGSFKANLFDNCASKDRYLTLIKRGRK
ncbi:MAG TPA: hypothetical protein DCS07_01245 [Bdellovibrionales bacterium]|nr:MAG: hypothetical protein A2Z97_01585 [Bdellovibrionales bacterium GWB1_52_6]OFZ05031.1 MAG: hypothetical protein A2X97_00345 [Bdellovibrionales bacterium GWA1_52_35]OFZ43262.1 MAG: hypothetical protein A2070_12820 [Bdellovibrionales bacterium GWC1_52_8]HAR41252.1 hypothetical protein [Bdellovibrionales bacterium]HCM41264.1 hypothetical protein [Bdellovibrionales bacterium]